MSKRNFRVKDKPQFVGVYTDNYDIPILDSVIKDYLASLKYKVPYLKSKIEDNKELMLHSSISERSYLKSENDSLLQEIEECEGLKLLNVYKSETASLIENYISGKGERRDIIENYILIARKYCLIDVTRKPAGIENCEACGTPINEIDRREEALICGTCQMVISCNHTGRYIEDVRYVDLAKSTQPYDEVIKKMLNSFQGKIIADDNTIFAVDKYLSKHGPRVEDTDNCKYTKSGKVVGTSVSIMRRILEELGLKSESKSIHYICFICWGWKLNDLSEIEGIVLEMYKKLRANYNIMYKSRKTPNNFILYKILRKYGIHCDPEDFNLPVSSECNRELSNSWKKISADVVWEVETITDI